MMLTDLTKMPTSHLVEELARAAYCCEVSNEKIAMYHLEVTLRLQSIVDELYWRMVTKPSTPIAAPLEPRDPEPAS